MTRWRLIPDLHVADAVDGKAHHDQRADTRTPSGISAHASLSIRLNTL
jgi:hypothetical protein